MALNDTPQANQRINTTQPLIRNNFTTIDNAFSINHGDYGSADVGKHIFITYVRQAADPAAPGATELNVYSKLNATTNRSELYLQRNAGSPFSFTEGSLNNPGYTMLPSGLLMKWALVTGLVGGSNTINGNALPFVNVGSGTGPDFGGIIGVQVTTYNNVAADSNTFVRLLSVTGLTTFQVFCTQRTTTANAAAAASCLVLGTRA